MYIYKTEGTIFAQGCLTDIIYYLHVIKERFHLGQFHHPQNWARNMRVQLVQNLKQEENNGGVPIL